MMQIKGLQKLTLLDFPDKTACTVFLGGCNLRCPFCHNASLVLRGGLDEGIPEEEFFDFLEARRGKLGGVCISGGEPTLSHELPVFIRKIKEMGFSVKLDTNGTNPKMLGELIDRGLIDYVAMDIKSSKCGYGRAVGIPQLDIQNICESIDILRSGRVDYEFRTTVVRELHTKEDMRDIGEWLREDEKYFLQSFKDSGDILEGGYSAYSEAEMKELLSIVKEFIPLAQIRG